MEIRDLEVKMMIWEWESEWGLDMWDIMIKWSDCGRERV